MTVTTVATLAVLPVLVAMHLPGVGHHVAHVYTGCLHILTDMPPPKAGVVVLAAVAGVAPAGWVCAQLIHVLASARQARARHLHRVALVATEVNKDTIVVDDERPAIYCIAGGRGHIVLTQGALARLGRPQLAAVCAHERAHLRGHHHLLTGLADGLARAAPRIRICRAAQIEIRRLMELRADDVALRRHSADVLASALTAVRCAAVVDTYRRRRLRSEQMPPGRLSRAAVALTAAGLVILPPLFTAGTVVGHADVCDVEPHHGN